MRTGPLLALALLAFGCAPKAEEPTATTPAGAASGTTGTAVNPTAPTANSATTDPRSNPSVAPKPGDGANIGG